ncbi:hypothetical protein IU474_08940 [Nocardia otitidiscaviarum]|uniref:hypothetical protein n=1 Tax=Nocardia otitidiscaviarum TaxID=1823 RepID=UPI001894B1B9|nr:hypothetical protein [Nocardia otitidiscaviarum]MBF6237191.1 hypothetical protein [Nocardia otitidiscaviarum]
MTDELESARGLLAAGDVPGAVRALRPVAETAPLPELAEVVAQAAAAIGFDDLTEAARAAAAAPEDPVALFHFGIGCTERGIAFLAVPALRAALRYAPGQLAIVGGLSDAFEREYRHGEAAALLAAHDAVLSAWPHRYLLVFNAVLADDLPLAREQFARLPAPEDRDWWPAYDRLRNMLRRAEIAATAGPLDGQDLRGWHFVITGGYLATMSPFGFAAGMTGRWAYTQDSHGQCRQTLDRVALVLAAADRRPRAVALLPGRGDRILGLAAAELLGLPTRPYTPDATDALVVAYDLRELDGELEPTLRDRADGRILVEHASCWTSPPPLSADITGLLGQHVVPPWESQLHITPDGVRDDLPADERPEAEIAADIVAADGTPDPGDGDTPADPDTALTAFVTTTHPAWLTGPRFAVDSPGPVRSNHFG